MHIEFDHAALVAALDTPEAHAGMQQAMDRIEGRAVDTSPVETGHYKASWRTEVVTEGGKAVGRLLNDADYSYYVEEGNSEGAPAQHVARNAAMTALR